MEESFGMSDEVWTWGINSQVVSTTPLKKQCLGNSRMLVLMCTPQRRSELKSYDESPGISAPVSTGRHRGSMTDCPFKRDEKATSLSKLSGQSCGSRKDQSEGQELACKTWKECCKPSWNWSPRNLLCSLPQRKMRGQAHLADGEGSVPDHHNKAQVAIKWVVIFLPEESLAFYL